MAYQKTNLKHNVAVIKCSLSWPVRRESFCCCPYCFRHCPPDYLCLQVGDNPNHGYTSFDNFLWSMLTTFQLITLDYWENVYNMVRRICSWSVVRHFVLVPKYLIDRPKYESVKLVTMSLGIRVVNSCGQGREMAVIIVEGMLSLQFIQLSPDSSTTQGVL